MYCNDQKFQLVITIELICTLFLLRMYVSSSEASAIEDVLGTDTLPDGEEIVVVNSGTR